MNSELEVGQYIWEWPKNNYKTVQFSEYKFVLKKLPVIIFLPGGQPEFGKHLILLNQREDHFDLMFFMIIKKI